MWRQMQKRKNKAQIGWATATYPSGRGAWTDRGLLQELPQKERYSYPEKKLCKKTKQAERIWLKTRLAQKKI
ncbi:hypothetical protein AA0312_0578 [Acetobacter tropicalis NRIC 0312]|nr:hypothetical protein ATR1_449c0003 [Acetobacter tropicalis]GBR67741.1 hypothetical protein AA0312_0578 [Acetobacter tropicalis NRIC 0312]